MFFDDFDTQSDFGFEQSDRDAYEDQQVFLDDMAEAGLDEFADPRDEDWAMDQEEECDWNEFADNSEFEYHDYE